MSEAEIGRRDRVRAVHDCGEESFELDDVEYPLAQCISQSESVSKSSLENSVKELAAELRQEMTALRHGLV